MEDLLIFELVERLRRYEEDRELLNSFIGASQTHEEYSVLCDEFQLVDEEITKIKSLLDQKINDFIA